MAITACEAPHALHLTQASKGASALSLDVAAPAVGSAITEHPLPSVGTHYDPPPGSFDVRV